MTLYNCRTAATEGDYRITKFTNDLDVEASYLTSATECDCPAGVRPSCRHRDMLQTFLATGRIDCGWMLDYNTREPSTWRQYVGPLGIEPEPQAEHGYHEFASDPEAVGSAPASAAPDAPAPQPAASGARPFFRPLS